MTTCGFRLEKSKETEQI